MIIPTSKLRYSSDDTLYDILPPQIVAAETVGSQLATSGENRTPYASQVKMVVGTKEYTMDVNKYAKLASAGVPPTNAMNIASATDNPGVELRDAAMSSLANARAAVSPMMAQAAGLGVPVATYSPVAMPAVPQPLQQPMQQPVSPPMLVPAPVPTQMPGVPAGLTRGDLQQIAEELQANIFRGLDLLYNPLNELVAIAASKQAAEAPAPLAGVFGTTVREPDYQVYFNMGALGVMSASYHAVVVSPQALVLAYDTRFRHNQYVPPVSSVDLPPWQISVVDTAGQTQGPFSCVSLGLQFSLEHVDYVVLLRDGSASAGGSPDMEA